MMQIGLISLGSGAASALLFASVASGSVLSIALFYLAPLPILIAVLGWTHWAGLTAAFGAAITLALVLGHVFFLAFLLSVGLPAWWLGYLAMLARQVGNGAAGALEWYPVGRLVLWAALLGALIVIVAVPNFGFDEESFRTGLRRGFERVLRAQTDLPADAPLTLPGMGDATRLIDILVAVVPPAAAVLATITNLINLWLAAKVVTYSGRLRRPWPDLPMLELPMLAVGIFVAALVAIWAGGLLAVAGSVVAASLLMAFAILGFAVVHALTRGMDARPFVLTGVYAAVLVFGWPVLGLSLLGFGEIFLHIRNRVARLRGPPATT